MIITLDATRLIRGTSRILTSTMLAAALVQALPANVVAQESKGVHVCRGTDDVLRFTSGNKCPQGQKMFRLAEVEDEVGVTKEKDDPPNQVVADLKSKIDFLTKRVSNLEAELKKIDDDSKLEGKVKAPFEVLDKSGNPIFVVTDAPHKSVTRKGRIQVGRGAAGSNFSMLAHNGSGVVVAGMGESGEGAGALGLYDRSGGERVVVGEEGVFVSNNKAVRVAALQSGPAGGGQFWLMNPSGQSMVSAGTLPEGVGTVIVGPGYNCEVAAGLRVPTCIKGRVK